MVNVGKYIIHSSYEICNPHGCFLTIQCLHRHGCVLPCIELPKPLGLRYFLRITQQLFKEEALKAINDTMNHEIIIRSTTCFSILQVFVPRLTSFCWESPELTEAASGPSTPSQVRCTAPGGMWHKGSGEGRELIFSCSI